MEDARLSISIVNWNTRDRLKDCLKSIYNNANSVTFETIVVDNNSGDDSSEMVRTMFPQVRLLENAENIGFGRANNQAIRASNGQYVLILNPDTLLSPGCLDSLVSLLAERTDVGAVGPKILNPDGSIQLTCIRNMPTVLTEFVEAAHLVGRFPRNRIVGHHYMTYCDRNVAREVDLLSGCCLMAKKAVLEAVGSFDEAFFIFGEDMDLCYSIRKAGWKLWYLPSAEVIHFWGESTKQIPREQVFHRQQAKYLFFRKHFGARKAFEFRLVTLIASILVYLAYVFLYPLSDAQKKVRLRNMLSENHWVLKWLFARRRFSPAITRPPE